MDADSLPPCFQLRWAGNASHPRFLRPKHKGCLLQEASLTRRLGSLLQGTDCITTSLL